jgi:hypothetical protein
VDLLAALVRNPQARAVEVLERAGLDAREVAARLDARETAARLDVRSEIRAADGDCAH